MENKFKSQDFYLSCILLATGLSLKSLERDTNRIATFVFHDPKEQAEEIILKHWTRELEIPSRNIIEAINELKTRLHSGV